MELIGEEKKIQALFYELRLDDQSITPRFNSVWMGAGSRTSGPRQSFRLWLAAAAVLFMFSLFSLAMWSIPQQQTQRPGVAVSSGPAYPSAGLSETTRNQTPNLPSTVAQHHRGVVGLNLIRFAAHRKAAMLAARQAEIRNAAAISSWQSPTITFLRSPGDKVLSSLPQLNESANELRSFLPGGNDY